MRKNIFLLCIACIILFSGCKEKKKEQSKVLQTKGYTFRLPEIPIRLTHPQERAEYLIKHYWDYFVFTDISLNHKSEIIEPIFANFIGVLSHATYQVACAGIKDLMKRTEANTLLYIHFSNLAEKYLYDPNSPMHNEEFYIPFLECIVTSKVMDETHKNRFSHQLKIAVKNRPGNIATNFMFTLASGKSEMLSKINNEYILLFFNNPDCEICREIKEQIIASPILVDFQRQETNKQKRLVVLSIYTDEDLATWRKYLPEYPSSWINGYDKKLNIRSHEQYDLKVIPTLYLLGHKKRIILKDVPFRTVEHYLENL